MRRGLLVELPRPHVDEEIAVANGLHGNGPETRCRLRVWIRRSCGITVALVSELAANAGMSVTNNIEALITYVDLLYPGAVVVEHYDSGSYQGGRSLQETFDRVDLLPDGEPVWHSMSAGAFADLVSR